MAKGWASQQSQPPDGTPDGKRIDKQRTGYSRPTLTESWADETYIDPSSDDSSDFLAQSHSSPQRQTRPTTRIPTVRDSESTSRTPTQRRVRHDGVEPQFIMPTIGQNGGVDESWVETRNQSPQPYTVGKRSSRNTSSRSPRKLRRHESMSSEETPPRKSRTRSHNEQTSEPFHLFARNSIIQPFLAYIFSTLFFVLRILQPVIAAFVAVWILKASLLHIVSPIAPIASLLQNIPGPCDVPILNLISLCNKHSFSRASEIAIPELMDVHELFEGVLSDSITDPSLPQQMLQSESAVRYLKAMVTYSEIPSRNELTTVLHDFIEGVSQAQTDLADFDAELSSVAGTILLSNRWILKGLDVARQRYGQRDLLTRLLIDTIWPPPSPGEVVAKEYVAHIGRMLTEIQDLLQLAESQRSVLLYLDALLDDVAQILVKDGVDITRNRDQILAQLWTKLGGNRSAIQKTEEQLEQLRNSAKLRNSAFTQVEAARLVLMKMQAALKNIQAKVSDAKLVVDEDEIEFYVHKIQVATNRLQEIQRQGIHIIRKEARTPPRSPPRSTQKTVDPVFPYNTLKPKSPSSKTNGAYETRSTVTIPTIVTAFTKSKFTTDDSRR